MGRCNGSGGIGHQVALCVDEVGGGDGADTVGDGGLLLRVKVDGEGVALVGDIFFCCFNAGAFGYSLPFCPIKL